MMDRLIKMDTGKVKVLVFIAVEPYTLATLKIQSLVAKAYWKDMMESAQEALSKMT